MYTYPLDAFDFYEGAKQVGKSAFFVEVKSVVSNVLSDDYQLFNAFGSKLFGFGDKRLNRGGNVSAPHQWDSTETTRTVAALRYFEISVIFRGSGEAFAYELVLIVRPQHF